MELIVKQRLVGMVVIISLAVIFLPIFLGGKGEFAADQFESNIPEPPSYLISVPTILDSDEVKTLPSPVLIDELRHDAEPKIKISNVSSSVKGDKKANSSASKAPQAIEKQVIVKPSKPPAKNIKQASATLTTPVKPPAVKTFPVSTTIGRQHSEVTGWVVQVGSFKIKKNAVNLRNRLRKQGYPSYVQTIKKNNGRIFRVRVGPQPQRSISQVTKKKLQQNEKLSGIVMRYP